MDDDTGTDTDREIFRLLRYSRSDGERWDTWRRITTDTVSEANPQFVFNTAGNSGYYWVHGNAFVSSGVNSFTVTTQVALDEYSSNLAGFRVAQSASNRNVICWSEPSEYGSDLWAAFRDPVTNTWGNPQQLTSDPELERQTACAFLGNDTLVFLYDKVTVETETVEEVAASGRTVSVVRPLAGATGLATVTHQIGTDLAMKPYSLMADPPNPRPGSDVDLYATAVNLGNTSHASVIVGFYAGDPGAGGTLLGTAAISGAFVPGREAAVWVSCTLPASAVPLEIYAVVDPDATVAGDDPSNNTISMGVALPDIAALGLLRADLPDGTIALTGRMRNTGTGDAGPFHAQIRRDSPWGPVIGEADCAGLAPGEAVELRAVWDPAGVSFDALWLYLVADSGGSVAEFDETNNTYCLRVNSLMLKGDIDHNGVVDARDAALGISAAAGLAAVDMTLGDMNWDKGIDVSDVLLILQASFGTR